MKNKFVVLIGIFAVVALIFVAMFGAKKVYRKYIEYKNSVVLKKAPSGEGIKIIFFHHSTGKCIWDGGVAKWFKTYNKQTGTNYHIIEQSFPKKSPYGPMNYPYDYWNIWVKNQGPEPFKNEPTLEMISEQYDVIVWKHCFPVSDIFADTGNPDIHSQEKRIENYKLHYEALKNKFQQMSDTIFIVWTGPALVKGNTNEEIAQRALSFYSWVKNEWDQSYDNIFLWDFFELETEGGFYFRKEYAVGEKNSHPNEMFSKRVAPYFCQRIVDVIEGRGDQTNMTGKDM